jgi:hypothetical protein
MKKSLAILIGALVIVTAVGLARAQSDSAPATKDVLPSGPLIVRQMPALAQWTIDYTYTDVPKPGAPSLLDQYKQAALQNPSLAKAMEDPQYVFAIQNIRPIHAVVTKTGNTLHTEVAYQQDYKGEVWIVGDLTVQKLPNKSELTAGITGGTDQEVFPEFDWIGKDNFIGMQSKGEHTKCIAFKKDIYDGHDLIGTKLAWVDLGTRYPVTYQYLTETRDYKILPPPTVPLVAPEEFVEAGRAMMKRVESGTPHLAPP